jgi:hypothetical protein
LPPIPVEVRTQLGEAVTFLMCPALQLLRAAVKEQGEESDHETLKQKETREREISLGSSKKQLPQRAGMTGPRGAAAPRSGQH